MMWLAWTGATEALAGVSGGAGPYRVDLTTDPAVIPVGPAKLVLKVTDSAGKPVEGAELRTLTKMPNMDMGEREERARPLPGEPGTYTAPAQFAMAGGYTARIQLSGPQGTATVTIPLSTGQNTAASAAGSPARSVVLRVLAALAVGCVLYRAWRTGQRPIWRAVFNRGVVAGLLLLALILALSTYSVRSFRRKGAMTPIQAQAMEMATPPRGALAAVQRFTPACRGAARLVGGCRARAHPTPA